MCILKPFIIAADFLKKAAAVKRKMLKLDIFSLFIEYCLLLTRVKKEESELKKCMIHKT